VNQAYSRSRSQATWRASADCPRSLRSDRLGSVLSDLDYERRVIAARLRGHAVDLDSECFTHPHLAAIFGAIRSIEAGGRAVTIPAIHDRLVERSCSASVSWIAKALSNWIESADHPRLHVFVERLRRLAELRRFFALADRVELALANETTDADARVERACQMVRDGLAELAGETAPRRAA